MNDPAVTPVLFIPPEGRVALDRLQPVDSTGRVADPPTLAEVRSALVEADIFGDVEQRDLVVEDAKRHHYQHLAAWLAQVTARGYDRQPERVPGDLKAGHAREYRRRMSAIGELEEMRPRMSAAQAAAQIEGM